MDDGSIKNKGLHLNTYGFSDDDIELLLNKIHWRLNFYLNVLCVIIKWVKEYTHGKKVLNYYA